MRTRKEIEEKVGKIKENLSSIIDRSIEHEKNYEKVCKGLEAEVKALQAEIG